ncbi:MAG: hypothetical protein ABW022_20575 [Actinoplanes sp.]
MVWYTGVYPPTQQGDLAPLADDAASIRRCVYQVKAGGRDSEKPQGDFVSGGLLPTGRWAAVKRAVQSSGKATTCTTPAGKQLQRLRAALTECGGQVAFVGVLAPGPIDPHVLFTSDAAVRTVAVGSAAQFAALLCAVYRRRLRPRVDRTYPFADARAAFPDYLTGEAGKVVITR